MGQTLFFRIYYVNSVMSSIVSSNVLSVRDNAGLLKIFNWGISCKLTDFCSIVLPKI